MKRKVLVSLVTVLALATTLLLGGCGEDKPDTSEMTTEEYAEYLMEDMTLEEKVCQMFIVAPEALGGGADLKEVGETQSDYLAEYPVGGVIFFGGNIEDPDQVTQMIADLQSYSELGLFVAVDEEGGLVARVGNVEAMGTRAFPPMTEVGYEGTEAAKEVGLTIGSDIAQFGFNLDFAPDADVNSNPDNPIIGTRSFSSDPETCAELVAACVEGFRETPVLCTLKHFPGHGDTGTDSHLGYVQMDKTMEEIDGCEMLPFKAGIDAGADFVMMAHMTTPNATDDGLPASLSYTWVTEKLKGELGFEGIVITDAMNMGAITEAYGPGEAAVMAIKAGVDMILMPTDLEVAVGAVVEAVNEGEIDQETIDAAVKKILMVKIDKGIVPMP